MRYYCLNCFPSKTTFFGAETELIMLIRLTAQSSSCGLCSVCASPFRVIWARWKALVLLSVHLHILNTGCGFLHFSFLFLFLFISFSLFSQALIRSIVMPKAQPSKSISRRVTPTLFPAVNTVLDVRVTQSAFRSFRLHCNAVALLVALHGAFENTDMASDDPQVIGANIVSILESEIQRMNFVIMQKRPDHKVKKGDANKAKQAQAADELLRSLPSNVSRLVSGRLVLANIDMSAVGSTSDALGLLRSPSCSPGPRL